MSYVLEILFAFLTLALPELGWERTREWPWAVPALVAVPYVLGACARRALLAGRFRLGALFERLLAVSPVLLQVAALTELGWRRTLERQGLDVTRLSEWLDLRMLAALAPYLVYQLAAIDARARWLVFSPDRPAKLRAFQVRLFLSALLPFVAYLAGSTLIARSPAWKVRLEEVGLLGGLAAALLLLVFLQGMPYFLRYAWDTVPIERGWARTMLEQVARAAGFRYRELLVWRTGQQMSNAAIVGLSPRSRLVFFSDLLLQQLGPRELAAVFAHEMGHARRAHAAVFGAFALGFVLAAVQLVELLESTSTLWAAVALVVLALLGYMSFGYLSRRFELEADLESLRVVGESGSLIRALELVTGAHAHERSSWRHFSTRDRVAFLQAAERDPVVGIRLKLRLARWRKLGFALLAVAALLEVRSLASSWDDDWIVADLRLGRFEEAAARAESPRVDPDHAALARRAASAPREAREAEELAAAALDALGRGDTAEAKEWLELARLRGARNVEPLIGALEQEEASGEGPAWREAVRILSEAGERENER